MAQNRINIHDATRCNTQPIPVLVRNFHGNVCKKNYDTSLLCIVETLLFREQNTFVVFDSEPLIDLKGVG